MIFVHPAWISRISEANPGCNYPSLFPLVGLLGTENKNKKKVRLLLTSTSTLLFKWTHAIQEKTATPFDCKEVTRGLQGKKASVKTFDC
eukprot:400509-Pelagomonas_calceolata.AAC.1